MIDVLFVSIFRASNAFSAFMTNLNSLELISLRSIKNGKISLFGNKELCFIEGTDFTQLLTVQKNQDQGFKIKDYVQSRDNRPPEDCKKDGGRTGSGIFRVTAPVLFFRHVIT